MKSLPDQVFASGLETVPDAKPLNNCRWVLFQRGSQGWERVRVDEGRTREPSPLAAFSDGRVFLSANPTLGSGPEPGGGPARPDVFQFTARDPKATPLSLKPAWQGSPPFSEHSYRSLATDSANGELVLFQNTVDYTQAQWTFRDRTGQWSAQGQIKWPWGAECDQPEPVRICYPNVAAHDRAVHFFGVSDIIEPYKAWRDFKRELTGQQWDYDFRRLFYTWTRDITKEPFNKWVEIASRDKTCGRVFPGDLWLPPPRHDGPRSQSTAVPAPPGQLRKVCQHSPARPGRWPRARCADSPSSPVKCARCHPIWPTQPPAILRQSECVPPPASSGNG